MPAASKATTPETTSSRRSKIWPRSSVPRLRRAISSSSSQRSSADSCPPPLPPARADPPLFSGWLVTRRSPFPLPENTWTGRECPLCPPAETSRRPDALYLPGGTAHGRTEIRLTVLGWTLTMAAAGSAAWARRLPARKAPADRRRRELRPDFGGRRHRGSRRRRDRGRRRRHLGPRRLRRKVQLALRNAAARSHRGRDRAQVARSEQLVRGRPAHPGRRHPAEERFDTDLELGRRHRYRGDRRQGHGRELGRRGECPATSAAQPASSSGGSISADERRRRPRRLVERRRHRVREAHGRVVAGSSGGAVSVAFAAGNAKGGELSSSGGGVATKVDPAVGLEIDASSSGGSVDCDLPLTVRGRIGRDDVHGPLNGGGPLSSSLERRRHRHRRPLSPRGARRRPAARRCYSGGSTRLQAVASPDSKPSAKSGMR